MRPSTVDRQLGRLSCLFPGARSSVVGRHSVSVQSKLNAAIASATFTDCGKIIQIMTLPGDRGNRAKVAECFSLKRDE